MHISRRSLLTSLAVGTAAATVGRVYAWEPEIALGNFQVKRATPRSGMVILSSNENPYGPLPKAAEAMRNALTMANRYPFRQTGELADQLAHYHGVASNQVLLGNGSTEVLRMAVSGFTGPGKKLIYASPTFEAAAGN